MSEDKEEHGKGGLAGLNFLKPGVAERVEESAVRTDLGHAIKDEDIESAKKIVEAGRVHHYGKELEARGINRRDESYIHAFEHALMWLYEHRPFYAYMFSDIVRRQSFEIDTLCVIVRGARVELWYNPDFMAIHSLKHNVGFLQHEMGHIAAGHLPMQKKLPRDVVDDSVFGLAVDLAVDSLVQNEGDQPDWVLLPSSLRIPQKDVHESEWESFKERQTWGYYFDLLREMRDNHGDQFGTQITAVIEGRPQSSAPSDEGRDPLTGGDHRSWDNGDADSAETQEEVVRQMVKAAYEKAEQNKTSMHGYMHGEMISGIQNLLKQKSVPFERIFRCFVGSHIKLGKRHTMIKISRRRKVPPGHTFERHLKILWAQDDSGSVPPEGRALCRSELAHANKSTNVTVLFQRFTFGLSGPLLNLDEVDFKKAMIEYNGGTDFQAICEQADDLNVDLLLIGTDGYAPTPIKPRTPVGWILTDGGKSHPWGMTIRLPSIEEIKKGHKSVIERWLS